MIYVGYASRINFAVGALIAGSTVELKIIRPGQTDGINYAAVIAELATGACYVDLPAGVLDVPGQWTGYPEITPPAADKYPGPSISFYVYLKNVDDIPFSTPSPQDVRALLEDYGLDTSVELTVGGAWAEDSNVISGANTLSVKVGDLIEGTGIPIGARVDQIVKVHATDGILAFNSWATASGTGATARQYTILSDGWILRTRDRLVVPWVEKHTRQSFRGVQEVTEYYSGDGGSLLILRRRPIHELISISYTNVDSNFYYLTPNAIQVLKEEGILKAKAHFNESSYVPIFYKGEKNLRVTYKFGYLDYPADVAEAVARLVAEQALAHVGSKTGGGNLSAQGYSRSFGQIGKWTEARRNLAKTALAILKPRMTGGI